jgi:hypothetical protein
MNALQRKIEMLTQFGAESIVDNTLNKLIAIQIAKYRAAMKDISRELTAFEQKYAMSSEDCYHRFNNGELGDDADFFEWTGLYENLLLYRKRADMLEAEK